MIREYVGLAADLHASFFRLDRLIAEVEETVARVEEEVTDLHDRVRYANCSPAGPAAADEPHDSSSLLVADTPTVEGNPVAPTTDN